MLGRAASPVDRRGVSVRSGLYVEEPDRVALCRVGAGIGLCGRGELRLPAAVAPGAAPLGELGQARVVLLAQLDRREAASNSSGLLQPRLFWIRVVM